MSPTELPDDPTSPSCLSPPPIHEYLPDYLPAYLSNGLIGARIGQIPLTDGVCVVNGLVERDPVEDGEGFARAPYPFAGDLQVDGHWLTSHPGQARFLEQAYNFGCGELHTAFEFRPDATRLRVQVVSFCSRSLPALVLQEVRLEVDDECELSVLAGLNHVGIPGRWKARRTHTPGSAEPVVDGLMGSFASGLVGSGLTDLAASGAESPRCGPSGGEGSVASAGDVPSGDVWLGRRRCNPGQIRFGFVSTCPSPSSLPSFSANSSG